MRAILLPASSVIQSELPGPAAMSPGEASRVGSGKCVNSPLGVSRPTPPLDSVNQSAPSAPAAIDRGKPTPAGSGRCVIWPVVVKRPIDALLGEPQRATRAGGDPEGPDAVAGHRELGVPAGGGEPPDAHQRHGEPQCAIGPGRDVVAVVAAGREGGEGSRLGHAVDRPGLSEHRAGGPERAVGPRGDVREAAPLGGLGELLSRHPRC